MDQQVIAQQQVQIAQLNQQLQQQQQQIQQLQQQLQHKEKQLQEKQDIFEKKRQNCGAGNPAERTGIAGENRKGPGMREFLPEEEGEYAN